MRITKGLIEKVNGEMTCFDEVMRYALEVISREVPSIDMEQILDKEYILGYVRAQMVSAGNVILEPGVVYGDYLDMTIVYRVKLMRLMVISLFFHRACMKFVYK